MHSYIQPHMFISQETHETVATQANALPGCGTGWGGAVIEGCQRDRGKHNTYPQVSTESYL